MDMVATHRAVRRRVITCHTLQVPSAEAERRPFRADLPRPSPDAEPVAPRKEDDPAAEAPPRVPERRVSLSAALAPETPALRKLYSPGRRLEGCQRTSYTRSV
jgi:hypothetical protein